MATSPSPLTMVQIADKVNALKRQNGARDARAEMIRAVRRGDYNPFGDLFPADWPKPIIANFVDVAARDTAEMLAPLPSIEAAIDLSADDTARKRADKRNKILASFTRESKLQTQMYGGADGYGTYGLIAIKVEPDFENHRPRFVVEDTFGAYPEFDRVGHTISYTKRWLRSELDLCALYPELKTQIAQSGAFGTSREPSDQLVEVIWYHDADQTVMYLPTRKNLVLDESKNMLGKCMVRAAMRPSIDHEAHGQFDDVLWVQMARAKFALLALEGATKAVQAPLAVPTDVQDFPLGADAVVRSATPEKIGRVPLQIPAQAFAVQETLQEEQRVGARYPESRTGNVNASVITGRGVQELNSGFDSQIKTAQTIFAELLHEVFGLALELDQALWPDERKPIRGVAAGTPYNTTYVPSRDINGDYQVEVTYGLMAGMDPNRSLVWILQALGAGLIPMDWARRNLPGDMNVTEAEKQIDVEKLRGSVLNAVEAFGQAIPALAESGQDPSPVLAKMAQVIQSRMAGESVENAVANAFAPTPPAGPPGSEPPVNEGAPGQTAPGGGSLPPGLQPSGLMAGVAPGQAGLPPGGRPTVQDLLAGLTSGGSPNLGANVRRRIPTG